MKKGIGKALESGMTPMRFFSESAPEKDVSVLSNPRRLSILAHLLNYPCSPASFMSISVLLSEGAIRWHLRRLESADLLDKYDGRYAVKGSILPEHCSLFRALVSSIQFEIIELIIKRGPLEAMDLRRAMKITPDLLKYHLKKLENEEILVKNQGTYELGFDLLNFQKTYEKLTEKALARIVMDAKSEGVSMDIERKGHGWILKVRSPVEVAFEIYEIPFYEVLG